MDNTIQTSMFAQSNREVTRVGLGGEGILRTYGRSTQARQVIREAVTQGITYFDSAHVYADSESYYGSVWGESKDERSRVFQASKSASRDAKGAWSNLQSTLRRMQTDHLDLWQIHDLRTEKEFEFISAPGGALEAFVEAKASGRVRFIGVTGHHDPYVLAKAVKEWPVDAVMMPVNPVEEILGGFLTSTLPAAREKGIAVIGMKVLGASHYVNSELGSTPQLLIRFALSQGITVAIVGCSTVNEVKTLAEAARDPKPLSEEEKITLRRLFEPSAKRLAYYRGVL